MNGGTERTRFIYKIFEKDLNFTSNSKKTVNLFAKPSKLYLKISLKSFSSNRTQHSDETYYQTMYLPTHLRGSTFLIGMALGYFLHERKAKFIVNVSRFNTFYSSLPCCLL